MSDPDTDAAARLRAANLRTALVLASIALTFFFGVIVAKFVGGFEVGMSIVGFAAVLFLVVAIGRNVDRGTTPPTHGERPR